MSGSVLRSWKRLVLVFLWGVAVAGCAEGSDSLRTSAEDGSQSLVVRVENGNLVTPPAVHPNEHMDAYPSPGEFVAFSLKVAEERIRGVEDGQDYRPIYPEVFNLGGINAIHGLVYDREIDDVILVGKYNPSRQPLTLDDFVVALRARFIHGEWPVVSIDPSKDQSETRRQRVRFEGGIGGTQFGADLLDADYRLKQIGLGLRASGVPGLQTFWDVSVERAKTRQSLSQYIVNSRFWFYPVLPSVAVRENVVAIGGLKVGVFTEVLGATIGDQEIKDLASFEDEAGTTFAEEVSERYAELANVHPSFSRVHGLDELVALTKAIEEMAHPPDLTSWLRQYIVRKLAIPPTLEVLEREEKFESASTGYRAWQVSGGVQLMAIALRLKSGDVRALREAVKSTRPMETSLSWTFVVGEWIVATAPDSLSLSDIGHLFSQAEFLRMQNRNDETIALYDQIIALKPDWDTPYLNRGTIFGAKKGDYDKAISDLSNAIKINKKNDRAFSNRGAFRIDIGEQDLGMQDINMAININPMNAAAFANRGRGYSNIQQYKKAIDDYEKAISLNPNFAIAYGNRGFAYFKLEQYQEAIDSYNISLELEPSNLGFMVDRGSTLAKLGQFEKSLDDFDRVIEVGSGSVDAHRAHKNRGHLFYVMERYSDAVADFSFALKNLQKFHDDGKIIAEIYNKRGASLVKLDDSHGALRDFSSAIKYDPELAFAYNNRAWLKASFFREFEQSCSDAAEACELGVCNFWKTLKKNNICME